MAAAKPELSSTQSWKQQIACRSLEPVVLGDSRAAGSKSMSKRRVVNAVRRETVSRWREAARREVCCDAVVYFQV